MSVGTEPGNLCLRFTCTGVITERPVENCSCHISPPCAACVSAGVYCPSCGWDSSDDVIINDYIVNVDKSTGVHRFWEPRPLDYSKIDWRTKAHSPSSQVCEGVYPAGTKASEIESLVRGTFGGRFESFGGGRFRYIAYTD